MSQDRRRTAARTRGRAQAGSRAGTRLELDVGPVAHGGHCVARHEGRVVFVRHALPGERVTAIVTEGRDRDAFWRADAVEVLAAAPERVQPPCSYAGPGRCGGCDFQHVTPAGQRALKAAVVAEQLRRLAHLEREVTVHPVPGDHDGLDWRTRVTFAVDAAGRAGLHKHRSHDVVPIDRCLIAHPGVEQIGVEGAVWRGIRFVEAVSASAGERAVVVTGGELGARLDLPRLDSSTAVLVNASQGAVERVRGRTHLSEQAAGRSWRVTGGGFWQVHPGAAQVLVDTVLRFLRPASGESALDLYSGVGLFAGALADAVGPEGDVLAVESDARAVADARRNLHDAPSVQLVRADVDEALADLAGRHADLVVLDPPRTGAGAEVVRAIAGLRPRAVAYVACDPAALARDLATFGELGYVLADLAAFDCFPMTHHVECVALVQPAPA